MAEERWATEVTLDHLEMMALLIALEYVKEATGGHSEPELSAQGKLRAAMKPFWQEMSESRRPVGRFALPEPTVEDEYGPAN